MTYLAKILAADVIDLKPRLKQKKADDKVKKEDGIQPEWSKAKLRVYVSSAYAGGYELEVRVPVAAAFIKDKKKNNKDVFVEQLHTFINERINKWMGRPAIKGFDDRAKGGFLDVRVTWHFEDAFLAYALGLDLTKWHGSNDVVDAGQIPNRMHLAETAWKELQGFRDVAHKKLQLRSQDKDERNAIWKEEFMPKWVKLTEKWGERGLDYVALSNSAKESHRAVGFVTKIESHYVLAKIEQLPSGKWKLVALNAKAKTFMPPAEPFLGKTGQFNSISDTQIHWVLDKGDPRNDFIRFYAMSHTLEQKDNTLKLKSKAGDLYTFESTGITAAEDPIWAENQALQKLLKAKVKEITKIEEGSHGITGILVSFPTHNVEVTIGYDKDSSLTYDVFKIVDGSIASSKTGLKSRDEVVKAVVNLAK